MIKRTAVAIFLFLALATSSAKDAWGSHYIYLADDPAQQRSQSSFADNWVMARWWWAQANVWWSDPAIVTDVQAAINNWQAALPQLTYQQTTDSAAASLTFNFQVCPGWPNLVGCYNPVEYWDRIWERASYIRRADIYMNPNYDWQGAGASARQGLLAHELGHAYGLHERYIEGPPAQCNNAETTVMDAMLVSGEWPYHCDLLTGPAAVDIQRVTSFWSAGSANSLSAVANGSIIVATWKDGAYTEDAYALGFQYWNGNQWIGYHDRGMHDDIGVHQVTENRTLSAAADRNAYGAPAGLHRLCTTVYFPPFNQWGIYTCSNSVQLN